MAFGFVAAGYKRSQGTILSSASRPNLGYDLCEKPIFNFNFLYTDKDLKSDEDKIMSEIDKFIEDQIPKSTKKKTESDRKYTAFLEARQERRPVNIIPAQELNILSSEFIIILHKDDGEPYEVSTYSGIRYSIELFLRRVKHPQADLSGPEYENSELL